MFVFYHSSAFVVLPEKDLTLKCLNDRVLDSREKKGKEYFSYEISGYAL